jgi:signal transduction histidine kinase
VLASIDADLTPQPAHIDLDSLVLEEAARARTHRRVRVDTSAVSAAPAYANAGDVRRVVRNLLENAVTHAESTVSLTVDDADGWATLEVVDDGPGVPVEHRDRIFDRFYRAEDARSRDGGNGLGLSIARGLTERNGGRLELVGADDGATMRLRLPTRGHDPAAP